MSRTTHVLHLAAVLLLISTATTRADGNKRLDDIAAPDRSSPIRSWTPVQQYTAALDTYGYRIRYGELMWADELGDKLSQLGRVRAVKTCISNVEAKPWASMLWAVCSADVAAIDLQKVEAELAAEGIGAGARKEVLAEAAEALDRAKKIGAAVDAAAKSDAALSEILKLANAARSEWDAYARSHGAALDRLATLQAAARSGKTADLAGCLEQTTPPFAKLVRATKLPWESPGDTLPFYVGFLQATLDEYLTTLAFGACAVGQGPSGQAMYAAAGNGQAGGAKRGPRSLAISKYFSASYSPTFADASLSVDKLRRQFRGDVNVMPAAQVSAIGGAGGGTISQITQAGDKTMLAFASNSIEECIEWKETNKIAIITGDNISYEKKCMKRGKVFNQAGPVEIATVFASGIAKGDRIITVHQFPVVAWKGKKLTAVCGVALK